MLSYVPTAWSILRPLDYDSVRPPFGWYARANIGIKWDNESMTLSVKHTKIYFFSSISRNLHIISKAKPKWSFCWQISEFGCSHLPSPSMTTRDARHVAIAARRYGYNLRLTNRYRSTGIIRYQDLMDVTNILRSLPWSLNCVTMIWPRRTRSLPRSRRLFPRKFTALLLVFASLCDI